MCSSAKAISAAIRKKCSRAKRAYASNSNISRASRRSSICNGLGTIIVSTPRGVLSDAEAREQNVGGEVLAEVF
jgi:ribosomal protein S8